VTTLGATEHYSVRDDDDDDPVLLIQPGDRPVDTWRENYPYDERMKRSVYEGQRTRFTIRQVDPVRQWKLSPTDLASLDKWDDYTAAKEDMFSWTDTEAAPWTVVKSNDKKRARINAMRHLLSKFDYENKDHQVVGQPDPLIVGRALAD